MRRLPRKTRRHLVSDKRQVQDKQYAALLEQRDRQEGQGEISESSSPSSLPCQINELSNEDDCGHHYTIRRGTEKGTNQTGDATSEHDSDPDVHLVKSLPLLPEGAFPTRHWAGHLPASSDQDDKKLFYWLFEPAKGAVDEEEDEIPLVIWLNGGPGCSSMDGLWIENGPFRLKKSRDSAAGWKIEVNEHSWHNSPAWMLYIDQPVGTGLSFTKKGNYCYNDEQVNSDFVYFFEKFLFLHKNKFLTTPTKADTIHHDADWTLRRPLYFSGESMAGHYIPSMIDYILKRNEGVSDSFPAPRIVIPIAGAAIGNGWIDPYHQYSVSDAGYYAGIIDDSQRKALEKMEFDCQMGLKEGSYDVDICYDLLDDLWDQSHGNAHAKQAVSLYDIRVWGRPKDEDGVFKYPLGAENVETYLGGKVSKHKPPLVVDTHQVLTAIHATESIEANLTFEECADAPMDALDSQDGKGVVNELVRILDHPSSPKILLYNGMNDLICNHVGNERLLEALPWRKAAEFMIARRFAWDAHSDEYDGEQLRPPDGFVKQVDNLTFLKILNAGHMMPMDQPSAALKMMKTFLYSGGRSDGFLSSAQLLQYNDPKAELQFCSHNRCPKCPKLLSSTFVPSGLIAATFGAFFLGILFPWMYFRIRKRADLVHDEWAVVETTQLT